MVRAYLDSRDEDEEFFPASDGRGCSTPRQCGGSSWDKDEKNITDEHKRPGSCDGSAAGTTPTDINLYFTRTDDGRWNSEAGDCSMPTARVADGTAGAAAAAVAVPEITSRDGTEPTPPSADNSRRLSPRVVTTAAGTPAIGDTSSVIGCSGTAVTDGTRIEETSTWPQEEALKAEPIGLEVGRASADNSSNTPGDGEQIGNSSEIRAMAAVTTASIATTANGENSDVLSFSCISVSGLRLGVMEASHGRR